MPPVDDPARPATDAGDDPDLIAAAMRAGIDALLAARAPAEREAFWHAVALLYARGSTPDGRPSSAVPGPAPLLDASAHSHPPSETAR
ncbi:hypothetical protein [Methylobacterium mesophilicum]|uniref:hypothetical protein n=1 Tax=Methylobacterium mesophilicum TaxID=39956 RepID=UPI002F360E84